VGASGALWLGGMRWPKVQAEDHGLQGANSRIHGWVGARAMGGGGAIRNPR